MSKLDKIRGCLFGGAVGDALGYPVEFMGEKAIFSQYGNRGIQEYELDPVSGKALISDDTQMTLFTANGLLVGDTRGHTRGAFRGRPTAMYITPILIGCGHRTSALRRAGNHRNTLMPT